MGIRGQKWQVFQEPPVLQQLGLFRGTLHGGNQQKVGVYKQAGKNSDQTSIQQRKEIFRRPRSGPGRVEVGIRRLKGPVSGTTPIR